MTARYELCGGRRSFGVGESESRRLGLPGCEVSVACDGPSGVDTIPVPAGVIHIVTKPRRETNDVYAEVKSRNGRFVADVAPTQADALRAALAKLAA